MIKWLVQDVGIHMQNISDNFQTLQRLDFPFGNFGLLRGKITNMEAILLDPEDKYIIRGGTRILSLLDGILSLAEVCDELSSEQLKYSEQYKKNLREGIFYDEKNFDQAYYGTLDLPLLNRGAELYRVKDNLSKKFLHDVFIKPSKDQKAFEAGILQKGESIEDFILHQKYQLTYLEETAIIAPCKTIACEYRFFVVDSEVITGSLYRLGGRGLLNEYIPPEMMTAAKDYARLYQPHDVFTMDLCQTSEGISIVEYNCWNASGLYKSNIPKIFDAVNEYKKSKINKENLAKAYRV